MQIKAIELVCYRKFKKGCVKKMNYLFKSILLLNLCLLPSCINPGKYSPVNTYDLGNAKQTGLKLNIGNIDQNGPYNSRMLFRVTEQKLEINEFERWTQSPDLILNNYLKKAFLPTNELNLEGEIISFENNLVTGRALLTFRYKITKGGRTITEDIFYGQEPSNSDADKFAAAMSKLAGNLIQALSKKIDN